jgi:hypothetical protein
MFQRIEELLDSESEEPRSIGPQDHNIPNTEDNAGPKSKQNKDWTEVNQKKEEYQDPEDDPKQYERVRLHHLTVRGGADYRAELMVQYLTEMAQWIVVPSYSTTPAFRIWALGLLRSLKLPCMTIIKVLNLLGRHTTLSSAAGLRIDRGGELWRILVTSFLLANKLLDRESLQNQMWSEITGISLSELNALETAWLNSVDGEPGFDVDSKDFKTRLQHWKGLIEFQKRYLKAIAD